MIRPRDIDGSRRALGWDNHTGYSRNRGELMSDRAFGHGGFTGTSMWIDPELNLFVIFLGNRLHPDGKGDVNDLAGLIGSITCGALIDVPEHREAREVRSLVKAPSLNVVAAKPTEKVPAPSSPQTEKKEPTPGPFPKGMGKKDQSKEEEPQEEPKAIGEVKGLRLGIDVLVANDFKALKDKRVG